MSNSARIESLTVPRTARYAMLGAPDEATHWWVVLHGYGQLAADFLRAFDPVATDDRCIIAPEALSRFYVDDMDEHQTVGASWMTREAREDEIADYVRYLDTFADHLRTTGGPTPDFLTVLGFSQGAATATRWCAYGDTPIDRLLLWAGGFAHDVDLTVHAETFRSLDLALVVGDNDPYISGDQRQALLNRLSAHEISAATHTFEGGHRLDRDTLSRLAESS